MSRVSPTMKFEKFLTNPTQDKCTTSSRRRLALEEEVQGLQERLKREIRVNSILRGAMRGPIISSQFLSPTLPFKVQVLLAELAMEEEEILWLERKLGKLRLNLNREKKLNSEREFKLQKKLFYSRHILSSLTLHKQHPLQQQVVKASSSDCGTTEWKILTSPARNGKCSCKQRSIEEVRMSSLPALDVPRLPSRFRSAFISYPERRGAICRN